MKTAFSLLFGLRRHGLRAARTFINTMLPDASFLVRLGGFLVWALSQIFIASPKALKIACFAHPVLRTPIWLAAGNRLANHPWKSDATFPTNADVVVIGPGFTGAGCAYSRYGPLFAMVRDTVRPYLDKIRF